jgi:hypothetical protein
MNIFDSIHLPDAKTFVYLLDRDVFLSGLTVALIASAETLLTAAALCLEGVRPDTELHVHLDSLDYIDHACVDLLMRLDKQMKATGGSLVIDWSTLGTVFRERRKTPRDRDSREFRPVSD